MWEILRYDILRKVRIRWIVIYQDLRSTRSKIKWDRSIWAAYLSALLEVYDRLSAVDAADYEKLKDALLRKFDMTERGFRKKFRNNRPERSETFI